MKDYSILSEQLLIKLLKEGDRKAFTEIYDRYWGRMYLHVHKILSDRDDVLDVLQDLFSKVWLQADRLREDTNLASFLYVAARNQVFNLIQHRKVRNDYLESILEFIEGSDENLQYALEEKDLMAAIESAVSALPPRVREVFDLSRKQYMPHKEIAHRLNISDQTVRKHIQHALRVLRPKLEKLGVGISVFMYLR